MGGWKWGGWGVVGGAGTVTDAADGGAGGGATALYGFGELDVASRLCVIKTFSRKEGVILV